MHLKVLHYRSIIVVKGFAEVFNFKSLAKICCISFDMQAQKKSVFKECIMHFNFKRVNSLTMHATQPIWIELLYYIIAAHKNVFLHILSCLPTDIQQSYIWIKNLEIVLTFQLFQVETGWIYWGANITSCVCFNLSWCYE